jgi:hypothetical protein
LTSRLKEGLSLLGTVVTILAFGIAYGKTVDPLTALGVVGFAYLALGPLVAIYLVYRLDLKDEILFILLGLIFSYAFYAWYMSSEDWSMHALLPLVFGGVALLVAPPLLIGFAFHSYRKRHKTCPECANEVLSVARVCQYCRYRWQPPLPSPEPFPGEPGSAP